MALVPCRRCRQPFYASCHDGACIDVLCPYCEYGEERAAADGKTNLAQRGDDGDGGGHEKVDVAALPTESRRRRPATLSSVAR